MTSEQKSRLKGHTPLTGNAWVDSGVAGLIGLLLMAVANGGALPTTLTAEAEQRAVATSDAHTDLAISSRVIPKLDTIADRMLTADRLQSVMASDSPWARERQATMARIDGAYTRIDSLDRAVTGIGADLQGMRMSMTRIETLLQKEKL